MAIFFAVGNVPKTNYQFLSFSNQYYYNSYIYFDIRFARYRPYKFGAIPFISKIISVVPAVGELLTGSNNDGLIAGQFKLTGNIKNPDINLNEMSFAPGILREIFSRNWIKENEIKLNSN